MTSSEKPDLTQTEMDLIHREAVAFAGIGLYRYDFDGAILAIDDNAMRIFGLEDRFRQPPSVIGTKISDIVAYLGPVGAIRQTVRENGSVRGIEFHFRTRSGLEKWSREDCYLVRDPETGQEVIQVLTQDITERKQLEAAQRVRTTFEGLITSISMRFINIPLEDMDHALNAALQAVGEFAGADRSYIFRSSDDRAFASNTHEWCAAGIEPRRERLQRVPMRLLPYVSERISAFETWRVPRVSDLPESARSFREEAVRQGVKSFVVVPLVLGGSLVGALGFDAVREERTWSEDAVDLLRIVGEVFVNALDRKQKQEEIQRRIEFQRTVTAISNRFVGLTVNEIDAEIRQALRIVGEFTDSDRSYLTRLADDGVHIGDSYEWCAPGVISHEDNLRGQRIDVYPYASSLLLRGQDFHVPRIHALPPEARVEKEGLQAQGVLSLIYVPIKYNHKLAGYWGLESVREERTWPDDSIALLRILAEVFGSAIGRKRAEQERRRLEAQVQHAQKLESLGVLAGGIAHDFNNLLVGVMGNAGLALLDLPPEGPVRKRVQQIEQAAMRAAELTNQLLAYSGRGQFVIGPVNVSALVEEMTHLLETVISKKVALQCDLANGLPPVEADSSQIRQVVMNLITNASDAIGDKSGVILVRTGVADVDRSYLAGCYLNDDLPEGPYLFIEVSDTGCGMNGATKARIFDPFFSTKFTGRGLGLAATLGIIRGHRGGIKVYSEPGRGSAFKVLLPPSPSVEESRPHSQKAPLNWKGDCTILVVDDEESVRTVTREALEKFGFSVLVASDGREGLDLFCRHSHSIGAVLLDLTMPRMDGEEAFREMRRVNDAIPIILSSGYNEQDATKRFAGKGIASFLQKPYSPATLLDKLRTVLGK